jgi:hypothetical protein
MIRHFTRIAATGLLATAVMVACGDDDGDSPPDPGTGGKAATGGKAGSDAGETSTGGKAPTTGGVNGTGGITGGAGEGIGGDGGGAVEPGVGGDGGGEEPGVGGEGGGGNPSEGIPLAADCDLSADGKEREVIASEDGDGIFEDGEEITLTSDKIWTLEGYVEVREGAKIIIEPCTRVEGTLEPLGVLFIERGGQIEAKGTAAKPILFTSDAEEPVSGDWGGIVILGRAPTAKGAATFEGVMDAEEFTYGGDDEADNSGTITYTKIEYGGYLFLADKEVNGLSMASVGSGTTINHVMVSNTNDDCFEWWGGNTKNVDYLICNNPGDDMFDGDEGWNGGGKNWFGRTTTADAVTSGDPNGFEWDSLVNGAEPVSAISATNVTLCGPGALQKPSYGMVLRELVTGTIDNVVLGGFDFGVDARDTFVDGDDAHVSLQNSIFFGLPVANPADNNTETSPGDFAFDEEAWFETAAWENTDVDAGPFSLDECNAEGGPADSVVTSKVGAFTESATWTRDAWTKIGGGW